MRGRAVQVEVVLLDVLTVVPLGPGQAEHPLLQDRVSAVPKRGGEAQVLVDVADAAQAVLVPAVRPRAGVVVGEVSPRLAAGAVVLAHGAPCALREVRPPGPPRDPRFTGLVQPLLLGAVRGGSFSPLDEETSPRRMHDPSPHVASGARYSSCWRQGLLPFREASARPSLKGSSLRARHRSSVPIRYR